MPHTLTFDTLHNYDAGVDGISLTVELQSGTARARVLAKLDTGASFCIFQREHGEALGLDIEGGTPQRFGAATGSFLTYGHELTLISLGLSFTVTVYFAALYGFSRNVLGRRGWFDRLQVGLVDYEGKLFVGRYGAA